MNSAYLIIDLNKPITYDILNTFIESITDYFHIKEDLTFLLNCKKQYLYTERKSKLKRLVDSKSVKAKNIALYSSKLSKEQSYFDDINNNTRQLYKLQNISDKILSMMNANKTLEQIVQQTSLDDVIFLSSNVRFLPTANMFYIWQKVPSLIDDVNYPSPKGNGLVTAQ